MIEHGGNQRPAQAIISTVIHLFNLIQDLFFYNIFHDIIKFLKTINQLIYHLTFKTVYNHNGHVFIADQKIPLILTRSGRVG